MTPPMVAEATAAVEELGTNASLVIEPPKAPFNPFYSNIPSQEVNGNYEFAHYKVSRVFQQPMSSAHSEFRPSADVAQSRLGSPHRVSPHRRRAPCGSRKEI